MNKIGYTVHRLDMTGGHHSGLTKAASVDLLLFQHPLYRCALSQQSPSQPRDDKASFVFVWFTPRGQEKWVPWLETGCDTVSRLRGEMMKWSQRGHGFFGGWCVSTDAEYTRRLETRVAA